MSDSSNGRRRIAGLNQFLKNVRKGNAVRVFLASDADAYFAETVKNELRGKNGIELETRYDSDDLATMAGVDVPTAVLTEVEG